MKVTLTFKTTTSCSVLRQQGLWGDASLAITGSGRVQCQRNVPWSIIMEHRTPIARSITRELLRKLDVGGRGFESGDRIAFQLPGWCEFTVILSSCLKIGADLRSAVAFLAGSRTGMGIK